jgi:hypothetical protein
LALLREEQDGSFGPDEIAVMTTAFDQILHDLQQTDRNDPIVRMIAKLVIELMSAILRCCASALLGRASSSPKRGRRAQ